MKRLLWFMVAVMVLASFTPAARADLLVLTQNDLTHYTLTVNRPELKAVGGFDVDIAYDQTALGSGAVAISWGLLLGDPDLFEALISANRTSGLLTMQELSLLDNSVLIGMQPASFTLATIEFDSSVTSDLGAHIARADLSDGFGNPITEGEPAVPEPSSLLLLAGGLVLGVVLRRRRA